MPKKKVQPKPQVEKLSVLSLEDQLKACKPDVTPNTYAEASAMYYNAPNKWVMIHREGQDIIMVGFGKGAVTVAHRE